MIVYNITLKVDNTIAAEWLHWAITIHIKDILSTKCFTEMSMFKLLHVEDDEGITYTMQCKAESMANYNRYIEIYAPDLRKKSFDLWGNKFISFRSVMQTVY